MIGPQDILYFQEIAKLGNITAAANKIGLSQPSLTLSIKKIENELGQQVFLRSKKGVILTPAGKELLKHSNQLLEQWKQIKNSASEANDEITGDIIIGCHVSVGMYTLGEFMHPLMNENPKLNINLVHGWSRDITQKVINFEIDVALIVNPDQHPDLVLTKICSDNVQMWHNKNIKYNTNVLIHDDSLVQSTTIKKKTKAKFSQSIITSSLENITQLTIAGAGVGVIPSRVVQAIDKDNTLSPLADSAIFKDTIYLAYRVENKNIQRINKLINTIKLYLK